MHHRWRLSFLGQLMVVLPESYPWVDHVLIVGPTF
jgi:hypothetical protein